MPCGALSVSTWIHVPAFPLPLSRPRWTAYTLGTMTKNVGLSIFVDSKPLCLIPVWVSTATIPFSRSPRWPLLRMTRYLPEQASYRRDQCMPFLVGMLDHGVAIARAIYVRDEPLSSKRYQRPLHCHRCSPLMQRGTNNTNEPDAMGTAMHIACM